MEYWHISMLLLAVSLVLLCAEFFIPSGGMILVIALVSLAGSVWYAWKSWGDSNPVAWWCYVGSVIVLIPGAVGGALYAVPRTRFGKKILLEAPELDEVTPYAQEEAHLTQLVGKVGRTLTLHTPGGLVLVDGERMHSESEGMLIDPDQEVEIIGISGNRLVVRRLSDSSDRPEPVPPAPVEDGSDEPSPLDFDLPQS